MESIHEVLHLYRKSVIDSIFICLLVAKLLCVAFDAATYAVAKNIIRWMIILNAVVSIVYVIVAAVDSESTAYWSRVTGPYAAIYLMVMFFSCLLPFALLLPKVKNKGWAIFIIGFLINTGWIFERFVIIVTSLHRDYLPSGWSAKDVFTPFIPLITALWCGVVNAFFITGISIIVMKFRKTENDIVKPLL